VRELENAVEDLVLSAERIITLKDIYDYLDKMSVVGRESPPGDSDGPGAELPVEGTLKDIERRAIARALLKHDGYIAPAAKSLAVGKSKMYERIKQFGLKHLVKGYSPKTSL
jgi:DNA-binding NtrC family response regulator